MEPEGSLLCSEEPSTGPCPEPHKPNSYHPILTDALTTASRPSGWASTEGQLNTKEWGS
jgi:hypothetical protein